MDIDPTENAVVELSKDTFLLLSAPVPDFWSVHKMRGEQHRIGWVGPMYDGFGYHPLASSWPGTDAQWIFGFADMETALRALLEEKLKEGPRSAKATPVKAAIRAETPKRCERCRKPVLLITTRRGAVEICDQLTSTVVGADGQEHVGNALHSCR